MDSGGFKKACVKLGPDAPREGAILRGKIGGQLQGTGTFYRELCKSGSTDRDAIWDAESGWSVEPRIRQVCALAHTTELSVFRGDAALCQITLTKLLANVLQPS